MQLPILPLMIQYLKIAMTPIPKLKLVLVAQFQRHFSTSESSSHNPNSVHHTENSSLTPSSEKTKPSLCEKDQNAAVPLTIYMMQCPRYKVWTQIEKKPTTIPQYS